MSTNIYDLLDNEQLHSKRPRENEGPGKPDKSDQRRSQPRARGGAAGNPSQSGQDRPRVEDRQRSGRGGQGGRGGRGGRGRGGYHGIESDGTHRNFDRKQGEHGRYAPGEARKHGAVGENDPTHFQGSSSEFAERSAVDLTDANGDIIGDAISDMAAVPVLEVFENNVDPDDALLTYDQYLRSKARPEDDVNRSVREVTNEGDFRPVKALKKEEEELFGDIKSNKEKDEASSSNKDKKAKQNKKNKISLDEFIGALPSPAPAAQAPSFDSSRGGRGGFGGGRGGRGGFSNDNGPRNNFNNNRGGGRGGRGGNSNNRGGRGGFGRDNRQQNNVNFQQSDFPALQ